MTGAPIDQWLEVLCILSHTITDMICPKHQLPLIPHEGWESAQAKSARKFHAQKNFTKKCHKFSFGTANKTSQIRQVAKMSGKFLRKFALPSFSIPDASGKCHRSGDNVGNVNN